MYSHIFAIIAPVFICAGIGYGWAKMQLPFEQAFLSKLVLNIGVPALVVSTLARVSLTPSELMHILAAALLMMSITLALAALVCRVCGLAMRSYLGPLSFPNTMNMGLPVCYFAFGDAGLAASLGIYLVASLLQFTLGVVLVSGERSFARALRSPVILSGMVAVLLVVTDTSLPLWLDRSLNLLGNFVIPIMLLTLGVSLSQLRLGDARRSVLLGVCRIALGFGAGVLAAEWLALEGPARGVLIVQSAMPAAVFNYILATTYQREPEVVAGIVVSSTLLSFISLPLLLWFLG